MSTCHTYLVEISKVRQVPLPQQVFFRCKRLQLRRNALRGCASTSLPRIVLPGGGSAGSGTSLEKKATSNVRHTHEKAVQIPNS